jgi:transposase
MIKRGRPRRKITVADVVKEKASGLSNILIAKKYNVSVDTVERRVKEAK